MSLCDVCILGAGPRGLSALSTLRYPLAVLNEDESKQAKSRSRRICKGSGAGGSKQRVHRNCQSEGDPKIAVVDREGWLFEWETRFALMNIGLLRSPAVANPDIANGDWAQVEFARKHDRMDELEEWAQSPSFHSLQGASEGLLHIPSNALVLDFCRHLVDTLPHDLVCGMQNP
mmetsp:Transcript_11060/g.31017  ORF Transcript_11060/g.31017 Transcript_11060/m.31017 type:complete len:174 (-) Transcript_11060:982-1503(-)